jgi:hypothetical protein
MWAESGEGSASTFYFSLIAYRLIGSYCNHSTRVAQSGLESLADPNRPRRLSLSPSNWNCSPCRKKFSSYVSPASSVFGPPTNVHDIPDTAKSRPFTE